tara:strand:+ start:59 stop:571 length:513 start_codon:yes stop_codon:yes gene_type:complete
MMPQKSPKPRQLPLVVTAPLIIAIVLLLIPLLPVLLAAYLFYAIVLQLVIWLLWCAHGINVLLITSESPNWHDYIETELAPKLPVSTIQLNWSERKKWKRFTLPVMAFRLFGGSREFNPMVIVFRPFRWAKTFRLWKAFNEFKHGKPERLHEIENELFLYVSQAGLTKAS